MTCLARILVILAALGVAAYLALRTAWHFKPYETAVILLGLPLLWWAAIAGVPV